MSKDAVSSLLESNEKQMLYGGGPVWLGGYLANSRFWFESFQNWQSEFLAIGCMVVFSIWLRQGFAGIETGPRPHAEIGGG